MSTGELSLVISHRGEFRRMVIGSALKIGERGLDSMGDRRQLLYFFFIKTC
jgi:hypothetical protein